MKLMRAAVNPRPHSTLARMIASATIPGRQEIFFDREFWGALALPGTSAGGCCLGGRWGQILRGIRAMFKACLSVAALGAARWSGVGDALAAERGIASVYSYRGGKTASGKASRAGGL